MRLSELKTGEKGVIIKVLGHGGFRKRIVEMGFIKGKTVEVLLNAPLKDPVKYKVMGYEISLRHQEADMIEVISEEEARAMINPSFHAPLTEEIPLTEEQLKEAAQGKRRTINVALVGNPNCGKTSLFNIASGAHEHVGNYSGVTVDAKEGFFDFQGYHFRIVDLPGTYSLSTYSPEEIYVRKHIIEETPDVIINVVDASNLERNLYLTTQLIDMNVKMVEYNGEKAYRLAEELEHTLIIHEDGRNLDAMMEEGLASMDAFLAVTGRSETNILAAMQAKRMGVKKVIAEVENLNYIRLAESVGIDTIINKKRVTASNIFRFTMSTDVQAIRCLSGSEAEVLEFIVKPNSPATKCMIKDMRLPQDVIIGGIVRGDKVFIAVGDTQINAYDRVVVFSMPGSISTVGEFFN